MSRVEPSAIYRLAPGHRMQWEEAQQCWVILYPEGMIRLNQSAAEVLNRCDGVTGLDAVIADLERVFETRGLAPDVIELVGSALEQGWLRCADPCHRGVTTP